MVLKEVLRLAFFHDFTYKTAPSREEQHKAHMLVEFELVMVDGEQCLNIKVPKNRYPVRIVTEGL